MGNIILLAASEREVDVHHTSFIVSWAIVVANFLAALKGFKDLQCHLVESCLPFDSGKRPII
jgi:hypothetical protein